MKITQERTGREIITMLEFILKIAKISPV